MSLKRDHIQALFREPPARRGRLFWDYSLGDKELEIKVNAAILAATRAKKADAEMRVSANVTLTKATARLQKLIAATGQEPRNRPAQLIIQVQEISRARRHAPQEMLVLARALKRALSESHTVSEYRRLEHDRDLLIRELRQDNLREIAMSLEDVNEWLNASFLEVTRAPYVESITALFSATSSGGFRIEVHLLDGQTIQPEQIFSEGYQDLLSLLFFMAVSRAAANRGQPKILILDDVLQSVDAAIRNLFIEIVLRDFADWQLILTVHDRLWRTQLVDAFRRSGHVALEIDIKGWDFDSGPRVTFGHWDPINSLRSALVGHDPTTVCGVAGRTLEGICDRLSWTIPISVRRKRGDGYSLGDTWPGVFKELRRTSAAQTATSVANWMHLRNAVGAHFNEWAESVSWHEAEAFGHAVLALASVVRCSDCGAWIERIGEHHYASSCGHVEVLPAVRNSG